MRINKYDIWITPLEWRTANKNAIKYGATENDYAMAICEILNGKFGTPFMMCDNA